MAAGKSSRYGSLKQTEIIGPSDVTLMEYSIYDAINIGFTEVILIIRKETKPYFETIKNRIGNGDGRIICIVSNSVCVLCGWNVKIKSVLRIK